MKGPGSKGRTKVLCIALDSVDKDLVRDWARAGLLPTFRSLLERARWGDIENVPGLYVGGLWTCFYTGASPAEHGRFWFQQMRAGTYDIVRNWSRDACGEPFWNGLGKAGRRVAVIDVPDCALSEGLNGMHVVDWGTHAPEPSGFRTWPASLASEITTSFGRDPVGLCDRRRQDPRGLPALRDDLLARVSRKEEISQHFLAKGDWDLFLTQFSEAHCVGHQFWHYHDPSHSLHAKAEPPLGDPVRDVYVAIDAAVGRLLERAGSDTTVFVLCTHGMGSCFGANFLLDNALLQLEGLPPSRARRPLLDTVLWFWQRLPWGLRQRLAAIRDPLVRRIDYRRPSPDPQRKYFQVPNNDGNGAIRINLRGRDPQGRVEAGTEYDALCDSLREDVLSLRNPDTGAPAVQHVLKVTDRGGPCGDRLPDLLVEWSREAPIHRLYSEKTGYVSGSNPQRRTGDHKPDGLFFATGPGFGVGPLQEAVSILDFAPTICEMLSVPLPSAQGKPIRGLKAAG